MARKSSIPQHVKQKVLGEVEQGISYSLISEKWQISKATVSRIKVEKEKQSGVESVKQPISKNEKSRRERIGKAAVTLQVIKKAEFIAEGFLNAFGVLAYNAQHLVEVIDHSKTEADSLKEKQEEILEYFKKYTETPLELAEKVDIILAIRQSIQKINDFFARDMIRIKAVGEMRKHLETFLKLKQEILDIDQIKKILDAFFIGSNELDDAHYIKYRDKVISLAPATKSFFIRFEGSEDIKSLAQQKEQNMNEGNN